MTRNHLIIRICVAAIGLGAGVAGARAEPVGFEEILDRARRAPRADASNARADAARAATSIESRQATLPTVSAQAGYLVRNDTLQLVTPVGAFDFLPQTQLTGAIVVNQPLVDAPRLLYGVPAARADALAARLATARTRQELAAEAAALYFDILTTDARIAATEALLTSLRARLEDIDSYVGVGRAIERDRLQLRLAADDAEQGLLALTASRRVLTAALGRAVGADEDVEPLGLPRSLSVPDDPRAAEANAVRQRSDLRALRAQRRAARHRAAGARAGLIPRLDLVGEVVYQRDSPLDSDLYAQGTLRLSWTPFAAGTRTRRADAESSQARALALEHADAQRGVAVAVRRGYADLEVARGERRRAATAVDEATEALRVTAARFRTGRDTAVDLVGAEATLAQRRARAAIASIDEARASVRIRLALGTL